MAKKPQIRFQGHQDEWKDKKLGDLGNTYTGLSGKSKDDFGHGEGRYVTYMNIFTNPIASSDGVAPIEIDKSQNAVKKGDILFTTSSETPDEVGMSSVWLHDMPHTYLNSFCFGFRPNEPIDALFSAFLMRSPLVRENFYHLAQGISRFNISKVKAMEMEVSIPSLAEQQKIGDFFAALDELIGAKEEELEKLRQLKQALLQQMFPANSDNSATGGGNSQIINLLQNNNLTISTTPNTPRIRFKGFTEPWEKKTIGELMDVGSVKRIHQADWREKGIRFMRARDLVAYYNNEEIEDKLYIDAVQYDLYSKISGKVQRNDLLVTGVGTIGVPFLIKDSNPIYFKDGNIIWLKNNNAINGLFLYYSYTSEYVVKFISDSAGVGTVGTYTITSCKETPILLPSKKEQELIGKFLYEHDEQINAAQQQIKKLTIIKQALLQKMFAA